MKKISFLIIALFSAFCANAQFSFNSITANGGFEVSDGFQPTLSKTGNNGFASGTFWSDVYTSTPSTQSTTISTTEFRTGAQSLKITLPIVAQTLSPKLRSLTNSLGHTINDWANFKVTVYAKVLKTDGSAFTGTKKIFVDQTVEADNTWKKFVFNSITTKYSGAVSFDKVLLSFSNLTEEYVVYLDDITVEELTTSAPTASAASNETVNSFDANWSVVPGATLYKLTVQTTTDNWATTSTVITTNVNGNSTNSYTVTGLNSNTNYRYKVEAYDGTHYTPASALVNVTTLLATSLNNISIEGLSAKNGIISFETVAGKQVIVNNSLGQVVYTAYTKDGLNEISLKAKGVYVLTVDNKSTKVIL